MTRGESFEYEVIESTEATVQARRESWVLSHLGRRVLGIGVDDALFGRLSEQVELTRLESLDHEAQSHASDSSTSKYQRVTVEDARQLAPFDAVVVATTHSSTTLSWALAIADECTDTSGAIVVCVEYGPGPEPEIAEPADHASLDGWGRTDEAMLVLDKEPRLHWVSSWTRVGSPDQFSDRFQAATRFVADHLAKLAADWIDAHRLLTEKALSISSELHELRDLVAAAAVDSGETDQTEDRAKESLTGVSVHEIAAELQARTPDSDEPSVFCPVGFRRVVEGRVGLVGSIVGGRGLGVLSEVIGELVDGPGVDVFGSVKGFSLPDGVEVFPGVFGGETVERLRSYAGAFDHESLHDSPASRAEVLTSLAAAGIPVFATHIDDETRRLIGDQLSSLISGAGLEDLLDPEKRDRLSIGLRRLGLQRSQTMQWRTTVAELDDSAPPLPKVSILLATNRPHYIEHALEQVRHQTYPELELVLILHGSQFRRTDSQISNLYERPLTIVRVPEQVVFGEALNRGVISSVGELVAKMDDDDWYAPEHIWDLVNAMDYSGADLVGKAAEFVYLEDLDITIRRMVNGSETYGNRNLAGGTFLIKRHTLNNLGGWRRLPRHIDQALIDDVISAKNPFFRTHGHGYLLHRRSEGHTWAADVDYFLDQSDSQQRGLARDWAMI